MADRFEKPIQAPVLPLVNLYRPYSLLTNPQALMKQPPEGGKQIEAQVLLKV